MSVVQGRRLYVASRGVIHILRGFVETVPGAPLGFTLCGRNADAKNWGPVSFGTTLQRICSDCDRNGTKKQRRT